MTEKRFEMGYDDGLLRFVKDNVTNTNLDIVDCWTVLNELNDENEKLKQRNQELFDDLQNKITWLSLRGGELAILKRENEQLKSDKEHLMGCLIRFFGYDDEDIDYNLNRESNREYGKQYYSMKEETKKELEE